MAAGLYRAGEASYNLGTPRLAFKALERLEPCAGRLVRTVLARRESRVFNKIDWKVRSLPGDALFSAPT